MNIRKHWKKVVLSCAAALWAGCGDDSSTQPILTQRSTDPQSRASENSSSSDFVQESSSGTFIGSSSSNAPAPLYGVYYQDTVRRASDTTIICVAKESNAAQQAIYKCTNGEILSRENTLQKNGLLYTLDEFSNEEIAEEVINEGKKTLDSLSNLENASKDLKNCLNISKEDILYEYFIPDDAIYEKEQQTDRKKDFENRFQQRIEKCIENYTPKTIDDSIDPMKIPVNTKEGDKFVNNGDTCEVVSTYSSWFGATGYEDGIQDGVEEISHKIDSLVAEKKGDKAKQECLETIKDQLDQGYAIYGPLPESYPLEIKCSDGVVKETEHYKARLQDYNKSVENGYKETIARANEMIDNCNK